MKNALTQFAENIRQVRELGALCAVLQQQVPAMDLSDLLRAQVVMAVSALDHLVHELVRIGMINVAGGVRQPTPAFGAFEVSMNGVLAGNAGGVDWLSAEIRRKHSWLSFSHPDKIAEACSKICTKKLWQEVAAEMHADPKDVRQQLELIVDRRNKISHEADIDPTPGAGRWPIDKMLADGAVNFVEVVGQAIGTVVG